MRTSLLVLLADEEIVNSPEKKEHFSRRDCSDTLKHKMAQTETLFTQQLALNLLTTASSINGLGFLQRPSSCLFSFLKCFQTHSIRFFNYQKVAALSAGYELRLSDWKVSQLTPTPSTTTNLY